MLVDVLAAGLHPRVRSQADGSHYTSTGELPLVPGIDGVGRGPDGLLRYFILPDTTMGAMAEQTVIDTRRSVVLPDVSDPVAVAAAMNPAMSSWVALRQRVSSGPDRMSSSSGHRQRGPDGRPGRETVRREPIIAAGRGADRLAGLPPSAPPAPCSWTATPLMSPAGSAGPPPTLTSSSTTCGASPPQRSCSLSSPAAPTVAKPLTWIEIGSVAGPDRCDPLGRAARRASADRRQRPGFRRHGRIPRRAASPGRADHQRHLRHPRAAGAARRRRASMGRLRRHQPAHRRGAKALIPPDRA